MTNKDYHFRSTAPVSEMYSTIDLANRNTEKLQENTYIYTGG